MLMMMKKMRTRKKRWRMMRVLAAECNGGIALIFGVLLYNKGCNKFVQLPSKVCLQ